MHFTGQGFEVHGIQEELGLFTLKKSRIKEKLKGGCKEYKAKHLERTRSNGHKLQQVEI